VQHSSLDLYSASDALPRTLLDPKFGPSYSVTETAFQKAVGVTKERWNWLEEDTTVGELQNGGQCGYPGPFGPDLTEALDSKSSDLSVKRPEHAILPLSSQLFPLVLLRTSNSILSICSGVGVFFALFSLLSKKCDSL